MKLRLPKLRFGLRAMMFIVAACALACWAVLQFRATWTDQRWVQGLRSDNAVMRRASADTLGEMGPRGLFAVPQLVVALKDPDRWFAGKLWNRFGRFELNLNW